MSAQIPLYPSGPTSLFAWNDIRFSSDRKARLQEYLNSDDEHLDKHNLVYSLMDLLPAKQWAYEHFAGKQLVDLIQSVNFGEELLDAALHNKNWEEDSLQALVIHGVSRQEDVFTLQRFFDKLPDELTDAKFLLWAYNWEPMTPETMNRKIRHTLGLDCDLPEHFLYKLLETSAS